MGWFGPCHIDFIVQLNRVAPHWYWTGHAEHPGEYIDATWNTFPETQTAYLTIDGGGGGENFEFQIDYMPITWGTQTHYNIASWYWTWPPDATASAEFDF